MMTDVDELNPRQIVEELDKYIIGQDKAKKAVAANWPAHNDQGSNWLNARSLVNEAIALIEGANINAQSHPTQP